MGEEYDLERDGDDLEMFFFGWFFVDGIFIVCWDFFICDNIFCDNIDVVIVVYCLLGIFIYVNYIFV